MGCTGGEEPDGTGETSAALSPAVYNLGTIVAPGKCVDVSGGSHDDRAQIQDWQCNGTGAQAWRVEDTGNSTVRLVNPQSGKCLDVDANGTANGTKVQLYTCNGTDAQRFWVEHVDLDVRFVGVGSSKCLDVAASGTADGTKIQLYSCNGTNAQRFRPAVISDGGGGGGGGGGGEWTSLPPRSDGKWVRVRNKCSFNLWIHAASAPDQGSVVLAPDDALLAPGSSRDYVAPNTWAAARVTAYGSGPRTGELEKAELTFGGGVLNYNVTYVDWVGLPLDIVGVGGSCNAAAHTTGCYARQADLTAGCPENFLRNGSSCLSARTYCANPSNQGNPYCHALDGAIASCASCPQDTTANVYMCANNYGNEPRWCAALNRGMTNAPDNANASLYYRNPPYNTYAKWVHQVCPDIYAFPYDDWLSHGGFRSCAGDEVRITFCPNG